MDPKEGHVPDEHHVHRTGQWLPQDHRVHKEWLGGIIDHVDKNPKDLHPVLKEFKELIDGDTRIYLLFSSMFDQVPRKKPYSNDPTGHRQVQDFEHMLQLLNHILTTAPSWNDKSHRVGLVGLPINALLDWPMGTSSGFAVFLDPQVNAMFKKVLNAWGEYLRSPASAEVLGADPGGWFGETGSKDLTSVANVGGTSFKFEEMYVCDPSAKHHGFNSWDGFFTRLFKEGIRPVAGPDNPDIIANACESTPYNVAYDVKARDKFWVKGQPYSTVDMLAHDELAEQFVGGSIYQAFLSALSYHRWHSPVTGKIVKAYVKEGTYYSEPPFEEFDGPKGADEKGESMGQGFITATATRAIIFIEADSPTIGLMAFLGVGMAEVSTCDITVKEGQHVKKGDEIGMFHFGGSTHCLLFRKGLDVQGFPEPGRKQNVPVRSAIAVVKSNARA
ncbi:MAG: phosphatidylserine decarboxylase [Lasallia pustulata]|uniref:Phosphatidylserine decarboxylase n=1 Tax=Lasallia pustulata TaxID=136370 RepID=A0A1W5DD37_9LECA|nr:MAG: phosphatidylserine decarboxylase [Lasallia pustulata]SLM41077.1 phosphatidylserine decarboxylase [Lasallia pustulata]